MISTAEVAKVAHRLGVGDRVIEKDYVLSWLLLAIADSALRSVLAFKGGTALKRCYYPDYRFSEDLDFTLTGDLTHEDLVAAFETTFPPMERRRSVLLADFETKCRHKGQDPTRLGTALTEKEDTFSRLWANRLSVQVVNLPDLNEILRVVRRHLRALSLM